MVPRALNKYRGRVTAARQELLNEIMSDNVGSVLREEKAKTVGTSLPWSPTVEKRKQTADRSFPKACIYFRCIGFFVINIFLSKTK